jgi:hypothetical protein
MAVPASLAEEPPHSCRVEDPGMLASRAREPDVEMVRADIPQIGHCVGRAINEHRHLVEHNKNMPYKLGSGESARIEQWRE